MLLVARELPLKAPMELTQIDTMGLRPPGLQLHSEDESIDNGRRRVVWLAGSTCAAPAVEVDVVPNDDGDGARGNDGGAASVGARGNDEYAASVAQSDHTLNTITTVASEGVSGACSRGAPHKMRVTRDPPQLRGQFTTMHPNASQGKPPRQDMGNSAWLFGNWGLLPSQKTPQLREYVQAGLKRNPALVIALAEAEPDVEELLNAPATQGISCAPDQPKTIWHRDSWQYMTLRGSEPRSLLIGVRANQGNDLRLLHWERRVEGRYRAKKGGLHKTKAEAISRIMIACVTLDKPMGAMGCEHVVAAVHMHNHLAAGRMGTTRIDAFWDNLAKLIKHHNVKVLMGDFNMQLFAVVDSLRSRGVETVECGAWYGWKDTQGNPCSDSCGIFCIGMPGIYARDIDVTHLTDVSVEGFFSTGVPAVAGRGGTSDDRYHRNELNGGPGTSLRDYQPKTMTVRQKVESMLTPCAATLAAGLEAAKNNTNAKYSFKEKRMQWDMWTLAGKSYGGSHYPLLLFTNNKSGYRSKAGNDKRNARGVARGFVPDRTQGKGSACDAGKGSAGVKGKGKGKGKGSAGESPFGTDRAGRQGYGQQRWDSGAWVWQDHEDTSRRSGGDGSDNRWQPPAPSGIRSGPGNECGSPGPVTYVNQIWHVDDPNGGQQMTYGSWCKIESQRESST